MLADAVSVDRPIQLCAAVSLSLSLSLSASRLASAAAISSMGKREPLTLQLQLVLAVAAAGRSSPGRAVRRGEPLGEGARRNTVSEETVRA